MAYSTFKLSNLSPLNLVAIFRCSSPPHNPVYVRTETCRSISFTFLSLFPPTPIYMYSLYLSFYLFIINNRRT